MTAEEWRAVPGHEGFYEVSDLGNVRSLDRIITDKRGFKLPRRGKPLRPTPSGPMSYPNLKLRGRTRYLHDLVTSAFIGPKPPGQLVRHLNGITSDARLSNLAYGTYAENFADSLRHGTFAPRRLRILNGCRSGHTYPDDRKPGAECRICATARMRRWRAGKKAT